MSTPVGEPTRSQPGEQEDHRSIGELLRRVTTDVSTLVRQEIALAKAEAKESAAHAGKGAGLLGGAGVSAHFVLLFLSVALWWGLGNATGRAWSALVVALVWAVVAAVLAVVGRSQLQKTKGLPQTQQSLQQIPNAAKGHEEDNR
ncbi:phage holin family protein [Pseudokineococcus basanitobsidens]|uniref:Phage holin family protein n=1 Tax=Pseudokineococcus basanitobsidens TaxID=1926649 RepID=A0ABU8RMX3_9ACTN